MLDSGSGGGGTGQVNHDLYFDMSGCLSNGIMGRVSATCPLEVVIQPFQVESIIGRHLDPIRLR
jgi:hypothetical protein